MNKLTDMPPKYVQPRRQRGLSLVELMISITVGLVLLAGISMLIVQQSSSRSELEKSSRQIENGRYAMEILRNDIEHAGFYGDYSPPAGSIYTRPANPCDFTAANLGWNNGSFNNPGIPVPIDGYPGPGTTTDPTSGACLDHYKAGTAVLVIRRTATDTALGTINFQVSQCHADTTPFGLGTDLHKKDCANLADRRKYIVRIYYVSTCDACGTDTIPTLKVVENGATPSPLVEGIENMQFDYGLDNPDAHDGAPDCYFSNPSDPSVTQRTVCTTATGIDADKWDDPIKNWSNAMAVRVSVLARNNDLTVGYSDTKSYTLGSVPVPAANDAYKRHAYSELVRAINPSGRREP